MHENKEGTTGRVIGIYHSKDLDGICCGAIMKLKYPEITLIGYDYGEDIWEKIKESDYPMFRQYPQPVSVIMADVSLPADKMMELSKWCGGRLTWIAAGLTVSYLRVFGTSRNMIL